jgi:peptidoglycan/xylan/chitin deacetylase (PgdA/CDA1 family)
MRELVLLFHGIGEPHAAVDWEEMRFWLSRAFLARLLDEVLELQKSQEINISITFDDGNASDAQLALPELSKRGLAAEFFICAGRVGKKHYLDQSMINELLAEGMSIGSHGMDHRNWRTLNSVELDVEIVDARRQLEDLTQRQVTKVAIPFGLYNRRVLHRLHRESLECIYTCDRGITQSTSRTKPREALSADMRGEDLISKLMRPPVYLRTRRVLAGLYKRLRR